MLSISLDVLTKWIRAYANLHRTCLWQWQVSKLVAVYWDYVTALLSRYNTILKLKNFPGFVIFKLNSNTNGTNIINILIFLDIRGSSILSSLVVYYFLFFYTVMHFHYYHFWKMPWETKIIWGSKVLELFLVVLIIFIFSEIKTRNL